MKWNRIEKVGERARSVCFRGQGKMAGYPRVDMPEKPPNKWQNKEIMGWV